MRMSKKITLFGALFVLIVGLFIAWNASTQAQHMKVVIPLQPKLAAKKTSTSIGLIGIAISGALIYSPFEADGKTVALDQKNLVVDGIPFFDACNGHPNPFAVQYHYHGVPH